MTGLWRCARGEVPAQGTSHMEFNSKGTLDSDHYPLDPRLCGDTRLNWAKLVSSKAPNEDLKDMDVLCTFKIKIEPKFRTWGFQRPVTI